MKKINGNILQELQDKFGIDTLEGQDMILKELKKKMLESALEGELGYELGYKKGKRRTSSGLDKNYRNGHSSKQVLTSDGPIEVNVPRDRNGEFEPEILPKRSNDISDWEQRVINMYGLGLSNADIKAHFEEIYGVGISESKITYVTNKVFAEIEDWRNRPLDKIYSIIYLDCIHYKVRQDGKIISKACYIIIGINSNGEKEVLTMIIGENVKVNCLKDKRGMPWGKGAKFWLGVVNSLKQRGVEDVMIASIDGLKGFPEAIRAVFPKVEIQLCIIHQIRNSTKYISYKDLKEFCTDLKTVYRAIDEKTALENLDKMEKKWGKNYGYVFKSWKDNWAELSTMFAYPEAIRKIMYTTNAIEGFNRGLRKYTKTKVIFPTDASLEKSMYLAMKNVTKKWTGKIAHWGKIYSQLKIYFDGRF